MWENIHNVLGRIAQLWRKVHGIFRGNKNQANQTIMDGFQNNNGTINVTTVYGVQTNEFCTEEEHFLDLSISVISIIIIFNHTYILASR